MQLANQDDDDIANLTDRGTSDKCPDVGRGGNVRVWFAINGEA